MALSNLELEVRWDIDHECYGIITKVFVANLTNSQWSQWPSSFFAATELIFKTAKQPIKLLSNIVNNILAVFNDKSVCRSRLYGKHIQSSCYWLGS